MTVYIRVILASKTGPTSSFSVAHTTVDLLAIQSQSSTLSTTVSSPSLFSSILMSTDTTAKTGAVSYIDLIFTPSIDHPNNTFITITYPSDISSWQATCLSVSCSAVASGGSAVQVKLNATVPAG